MSKQILPNAATLITPSLITKFAFKYNLKLVIAVMLMFTLGCKKDKADKDPMTLLTSKNWTPTDRDEDNSTNPADGTSYYAVHNCEKDDTYTFNKDLKLSINGGDSPCQLNEVNPQVSDYNVDFAAKKITIKGTTYTIAAITATQLKIYITLPPTSIVRHNVYVFHH
ncbi:hypothetical protein [Mucilaginibacter gynuensis]